MTVPVGATWVLPALTGAMEASRVPGTLEALLRTTAKEVRDLDRRVEEAESTLKRMSRETAAAVRLQTVPGIGLLTATALIGSVGEPGRFPSGRHLASFPGLVPRESSSGDRRRLGSITRRGDGYVRMLFTHGARSVLRAASVKRQNDRLRTWALETQKRKGHNKATVALANELTRIAWAVMMRTVRPSRRKADDPGGSKKPCYAIGSPCANLITARRRHAAPHAGRRCDCRRDLSSLVDLEAESAGTTPQNGRVPPDSA